VAELIFFFGLFAVLPLLMWWMIAASRRARAASRERLDEDHPTFSRLAFEEETAGPDGLHYGRRYDGDDAVIPPDPSGGELAGIKSLQGRR
jgi:hypothetical protein